MPVLLAFATVLFAYSERISKWIRARAAKRGHEISFNVGSLKILLPVSFYGGYFGAGVGILILGVFSLATGGDYRSANVAKNFVSSLNGMVATVIFASEGAVPWSRALPLMAGTLLGGLAGAYLARIVPRPVIRVLVVVVGLSLSVWLGAPLLVLVVQTKISGFNLPRSSSFRRSPCRSRSGTWPPWAHVKGCAQIPIKSWASPENIPRENPRPGGWTRPAVWCGIRYYVYTAPDFVFSPATPCRNAPEGLTHHRPASPRRSDPNLRDFPSWRVRRSH